MKPVIRIARVGTVRTKSSTRILMSTIVHNDDTVGVVSSWLRHRTLMLIKEKISAAARISFYFGFETRFFKLARKPKP